MSGNGGEDKTDCEKSFPLDLASKISTVKSVTVDNNKTSLVMSGQTLKNMRVLTPSSGVPTCLNTGNIISQAILTQKGETNPPIINISNACQQAPSTGAAFSRATQITLTASVPLLAQNTATTYHVPRGPAVVANLAAPRSNVAAAIRNPIIVSGSNPRASSPAWIAATNAAINTPQVVKGALTVLTSSVRGSSKPVQNVVVSRTQQQQQPVVQTTVVSRPAAAATILHSAITIGQGNQQQQVPLHPFKTVQNNMTVVPALTTNTLTLAQVLPAARTQQATLVYSSTTDGAQHPVGRTSNIINRQFTAAAASKAGQLAVTPSSARMTIPVVTPTSTTATRFVTPQGAVLTSGSRITNNQSNVAIGRVSVTVTTAPAANANNAGAANVLGQGRISTLSLHPLVVANSCQTLPKVAAAKVITQAATPQGNVVQRNVISTQAAKTFPQNDSHTTATAFVSATARRTSPGLSNIGSANVSSTSLATTGASGASYFYEDSNASLYTFNHSTVFSQAANNQNQAIKPIASQIHHGIASNHQQQQIRFNPVMVLEQNRSSSLFSQAQEINNEQQQQQQQIVKVLSSPRPSILRKRDYDGSTLKAAKNLTSSLTAAASQSNNNNNHSSPPSVSPPSRPDSGGSTTVSATSSPGIVETNEDSMTMTQINKEEVDSISISITSITSSSSSVGGRPLVEMSPRKKPRKQQFGTAGSNEIDENPHDDMEFITECCNFKKEPVDSDDNRSIDDKEEIISTRDNLMKQRVVKKPAVPSLLNSYRQTWKATHNHYLRYTDVKPKDERRPNIMDLANQCRVLDKINGWKVHHLSTQMEDLADEGQAVYERLRKLLKFTEAEEKNSHVKEINHINELIKGNLQRVKIINDGMMEAKSQVLKIFDHKVHVSDIINRCASKRNFKKREKS